MSKFTLSDDGYIFNGDGAAAEIVAYVPNNDAPEAADVMRRLNLHDEMLETLKVLRTCLILDLGMADADDDKEAMRTRIDTVTSVIAKAEAS